MIRQYSVCVLIVVTSGFSVRAQGPGDTIAYTSPVNIEFMSSPIAFDTEPVAGAPYSAEAVTGVVQTLADGNRIVRQNKAQISRDSHGRTRREEGLAMFGPLVNGPRGNELRNVQISDPTTGSMVMLDLQSRTAHRMPSPRLMLRNKIAGVNGNAGVNVERLNVEKFEMAVPAPAGAGAGAMGGVMFNRVEAIAGMQMDKSVVESLGTQFMEGIAVEGTRTTLTIPAGQIGNEQPLHIVSERWFSSDLKVLVMSRQSDPRFGETTYRLTNLTRAEPSPQLFEIPADFTIVDPAR
ncbi:MAG TPA: hypothetical protein VGC23_08210, partial [Vicinamibacterales bacterium]